MTATFSPSPRAPAHRGEDLILVLNCGSSSIKFAVFDASHGMPTRQPLWAGKVQGIGGAAPSFDESGTQADGAPFKDKRDITLDAEHPHTAALTLIRDRVLARLAGRRIAAVAHRVVHGGGKYSAPVRVTQQVVDDLRSYIPLAPLHQPFALKAMSILLTERPELLQVACFDTAFHHTLPLVEQMLPLPRRFAEHGLRRYGFHGLSYAYMAQVLPELFGEQARGRVIVAHLGSGASLCAMLDLKSVATTMGFSALDGLMMGTRTGSLDPGAILYLMEIEKLSVEEVGHVLYHESGLLGVSALSADPRVLFAREGDGTPEGEHAQQALALYVRRVVREVGALVSVLGGLDMLVFTAGVGENSAEMRQRICQGLAWLGLALDEAANATNAATISGPGSRVHLAVVPTNEEWVAAQDAYRLQLA